MRDIVSHKPCHICGGLLNPSNLYQLRSEYKRICNNWYCICDECLEHYPEIVDMLKRTIDLDNVTDFNHTVMFNLIDSVKAYRFGCRFIPKFRKGS